MFSVRRRSAQPDKVPTHLLARQKAVNFFMQGWVQWLSGRADLPSFAFFLRWWVGVAEASGTTEKKDSQPRRDQAGVWFAATHSDADNLAKIATL